MTTDDDAADSGGTSPRDVRVEAVFIYTDSGEIEVTQMFFGMRPAVLITPQRDGHDLVLQTKAVDLSPKHLVNLLRMVADGVEKARREEKEEKKKRRASADSLSEEEAEASNQSP